MTTTIVFGDSADGWLQNVHATYTTARDGGGTFTTGFSGASGYFGQNNNGGQYAHLQSFVGWNYAAVPATEVVATVKIRFKVASVNNASINRDLEFRPYGWHPTLATADWRTKAQLDALALWGKVGLVNFAVGKFVQCSSDELTAYVSGGSIEMHGVLVTSRQRAGTVPTSDEGMTVYLEGTGGTADDPTLVYTSAARSRLHRVLGAQVQLSDGSWCFLESDAVAASPTVTLKHCTTAGTVTTIGTVPLGVTANHFDVTSPAGAQALALITDASDNLYILGKAGNVENAIGANVYIKGVGHSWTQGILGTAALPTYDTRINGVAATWHPTAGGTIVVFAGHVQGAGDYVANNELSYALISSQFLLNGTFVGTFIRASGTPIGNIMGSWADSSDYVTYANEVGTGLDCVAAGDPNPEWGYFYSFRKGQLVGNNNDLDLGRYILNAAGNGFTHTSYEDEVTYGLKDAGAKLRVVRINSSTVAAISADSDTGYGLTITIRQHFGTDPGSVNLDTTYMDTETITSFPVAANIGAAAWWDAVYNSVENRLWIYYRDTANAKRLMRTAFDLTTMQAVRNEVQVYLNGSGTASIQAIRVARNAAITQRALVSIAILDSGTYTLVAQVDNYNLAPNAAVLVNRDNFDATVAALFDWDHSDPNPGDPQSAYQLEISRVSDGVVVFDSTKTASATSSRTVTGGTLTNGVAYRWRVKTWDAADVAGPYSGYGTFSTSAGGTVTVTSPATDNVLGIITDDYPITWSVAGTTQAAYRVLLFRGATQVSDSGWVTSTATTHTIAGMTTDVLHEVRVQVRNAAMVTSGIGTRLITPSFATPEVPLISVTSVPDSGYVQVTVENPAPGAPAAGFPEHGFEVDAESFVGTGGTAVRDTTQFHRGVASLKLTAAGPAATSVTARGTAVAVVPGQRYTVRYWAYRPVAGNVTASIDWLNSGAPVSTSAQDWPLAAATWTPVQASGTCPATANQAKYGPSITGTPAAGVVMHADELVLTGASDRPEVTLNQILRRRADSGEDWEVVGTAPPDGTFLDFTASAGITWEYMVRGQA